jgi:hypothetical protein
LRRVTGLFLSLVAIAAAGTAAVRAETAEPGKATWDQPANIRDAAERIAKIQRAKGAQAAIQHIDACYRTHSLASAYSAPFEGCIAQDYLQTKMLTQIYARLPADQLQKLKAPTPDAMAQAMGRRVVAAFSQYNVSVASADEFKVLVDKHGLPVFLKIVFPKTADDAAQGKSKTEKREKN